METLTVVIGATAAAAGVAAYVIHLKAQINNAYASIKLLDAQLRKQIDDNVSLSARNTVLNSINKDIKSSMSMSIPNKVEPMRRSSPRSYPETKTTSSPVMCDDIPIIVSQAFMSTGSDSGSSSWSSSSCDSGSCGGCD
ncbi:MAG: hypothetical protein ACRDCE_05205 [Cetobacterium sp.]|uniref:hypothetical protein n=1 Tax=Cetobacterium sp. TaxID=2071632 RepID=UPI003EE6FF97